jgi:hypothetical protein
VGEDWRVSATINEEEHAVRLLEALRERRVERDVRSRLGERVAVSVGDGRVFLYATTREAAREAEHVARDVLAEHGVEADFALARWHPLAGEWEPADVPLPRSDSERAAEHERLEQRETDESQASGVAQWEVRVELASHRDAVALAERLEADSVAVVRRWTFLLVGANNEDEANVLAEKIQAFAPADARVEVEPAGVAQLTPFAIFGGLGT